MERFRVQGWDRRTQVVSPSECSALIQQLPELGSSAGSRRLLETELGRRLAMDERLLSLARAVTSADAFPVRAILFDKSPSANWTLGWHQDLKIAVRDRHDVAGYSGWSEKEGIVHVQLPEEILRGMVAVRLHLDPSHIDNGPLQVAPGSHLRGVLPESEISATLAECGEEVLTASIGDVLLMHPLTLHASTRSRTEDHRRVVQIEYASTPLSEGLAWHFGRS